MAEAVLAGEQVKEFSLIERLAILALVLAVFSGFPKNLFVGDRP
jgi:hypothetical protein